jgi:putative hemolysin
MEILVLAILILINGLFALSEIALVSSKRARIENQKRKGSKGAQYVLKLLDNSENFLSAIQVGITLIGIVTGVYGGVNIADDIEPFFRNIEITSTYSSQIALAFTVVVITYFSIVIGELVPKTVALNNPEKVAVRVAPLIYYFSKIFYPFVKILSVSTNTVNKLIGLNKPTEQLTESELRQMIKTASLEGVIEEEQNRIHENVFYFADKKAKHIMTHRTDVEWIDIDKTNASINDTLQKVQHSKIICCNGSLDNFKGVLYIRDYYKGIASDKQISIHEIITDPLVVPEIIEAQKVLNLLRQKKTHICCVVNEYGGFEGLITLHDIIENIVGDIPDEGEAFEPDVFVREDKSVLVSGDAPVETLTEIIEDFMVDFDKIDYSTVAGFVFKQIEKMPQIGDKFEYEGYIIEIVDIDGKMIDKVLITKKQHK